MRGLQFYLIAFLLVGAGLLYVSQPAQACFSWTVTADDTTNGTDAGSGAHYTIYDIRVDMRPGCRSTYWLSFTKDGEPPGWTSDVLDETGHVIPWGTEFVLSGVVTYHFSFQVKPSPLAPTGEEAAITLHIRATDRYNEDEIKDVETTTTVWRGSAPDDVELGVPVTGETYAHLTWDETLALDFDHYEVHMTNAEDFVPVLKTMVDTVDDQSTTEYNVTGLSEGTTYHFRVRVVDGEAPEDGPYYMDSNEVEGTTAGLNIPPPAPILEEAWTITNDSAKLNWSRCNDTDFAYYELHASLEPNFTANKYNSRVKFYDQDMTGGQLIGLWENETVYVKVRVWDSGRKNNLSNEVNFTTLDYDPLPSTLFSATNTSYFETHLRWTYNCNTDFGYYEVHYSTEDGFTPQASTLNHTLFDLRENSTKVEGLLDGMTYYFVIRTVDNGSYHADSNQIEVTTPLLNKPPTASELYEPEAADVSDTWVKLMWTENEEEDFDRYEIYMSEEEDFDIDDDGELVEEEDRASRNNYRVSDLDPDTTYYFKVRTWDIGDEETQQEPLFNDSNEVEIHTEPLPTAVVIDPSPELSPNSITLSWSRNNDDDFRQYEVYIDTIASFDPDLKTPITTLNDRYLTEYRVGELEERSTYFFIVRVVDQGGSHRDSNTLMFETLNGPPAAIELNDPFSITSDSFTIYWEPSEANDFASYEVHVAEDEDFTADDDTLMEIETDVDGTTYVIEGLDGDTEYFVLVRTYDEGGLYNDSNEVSAETEPLESDGGDDEPGFGARMAMLCLFIVALGLKRRKM